jgi:hypothetical protein
MIEKEDNNNVFVIFFPWKKLFIGINKKRRTILKYYYIILQDLYTINE